MSIKNMFRSKKVLAVAIFVFLVALVFVLADPATVMAQEEDSGGLLNVKDKLIVLFGWLIYFIVWALGQLLTFVIGWLTQVASWDQFVGVDAVERGWVIVRDLCNMFFILILLVIAFATILRYESYNIKQLLPKVVIAAILINFSKTLCGVAVDFSQIIMLAFVNSFAGPDVNNAGANNLVNLLGMKEMMEFVQAEGQQGNLGIETVGGLIVSLIAALIAFVVICAMLAVLLFRVIMIWVYIVLSPLAFLLYVFPHGKAYASRWTSSFSKQLIVGPVLAFFLWLALTSAQRSAMGLGTGTIESQGLGDGVITNFLSAGIFQTYIVTIAFLIGGLVIAQEIGEVSGKAAGKGLAAISKGKAWTGRQARKPADWGAKKSWQATKGAGRIGLAAAGTADRLAGRAAGGAFGKGESRLSQKGLVATTVGGGMRLPSNVSERIRGRFRGQEPYRRFQREVLKKEDKQGFYTDDEGNSYKANRDGYYQQVDEKGNWKTDEKGNPQYLKDDDGKAVKRMNKSLAAFYDSWTDVQSGARAANNKAQDERVEAEKKKLEEAGTSESDLVSIMNDASTSRDKRMAAAIQAAIKKGFENKSQVDQAKELVVANDILSDKLEKEVDKNQPHLAYDFKDEADREKFKKKIDDGDIDSTKLSSQAYSNEDLVSTLREYHGKEFNKKAESIYKRGSKKDQDNLAKGLIKERERHYDKDTNQPTEDWKKMATLHARLTGEVDNSFKDKNEEFNTEAFRDYVQSNKPENLNKIKVENLEKVIQDTSETKGDDEAKKLEEAITKSFGYGKIKSMYKQGDNPKLVRAIRDMTKQLGKARDKKYIASDHELNSV